MAEAISVVILVVNAAFALEVFLGGTRTDEIEMRKMMHDGDFLVAQDINGCIVACIYTELRGERGYFGMLAVAPSRQGSGLGRSRVEAADNHCRKRGCGWMDISVLSLRQEPLPFYHKLGYSGTGTEEFRPSRPLKDGLECFLLTLRKPL